MDEKQEKRFKSLKWTAVILLVLLAIMCFFTFKQAAVQPLQIVGYVLQFALLVGIIIGCVNKKSYAAILAIIIGILFIISLDIISIFIGLLLLLDAYYILKNNK